MLRGVLLLLLGALTGCSSGGSNPTDGGGSDRGPGGSGGSGDAAATTDTRGGDSASTACMGALSQASFCAAALPDQIAAYQCGSDPVPVTRTCGSYTVWEYLLTGSQTCVYSGTALAGARSCDSVLITADCPTGCITYALPESAYSSGCGAETDACQP